MHLDSATAGSACRRTICASNQLPKSRMGFQKFGRCGSVHLRRNHARDTLYADTVDGRNPVRRPRSVPMRRGIPSLRSLPVKRNPDHHLFQRKEASAPHGSNQTPVRRSLIAPGRRRPETQFSPATVFPPPYSRHAARNRSVAPSVSRRLPAVADSSDIQFLPTIRCNALSSIHTSLKIARIFSAVIFTKSSLRGTIITPARSTEAGLTNRSVAPSP